MGVLLQNIFITSEHIGKTNPKIIGDPATLSNRRRLESLKEVIKGVWGMPRLSEAKKDVISCDKLRGSANSY